MQNLVTLKFVGGRPSSSEIWNRKKYYFNKENGFISEVPRELEQWLAHYAKGQYQVQQTKIIIKEVIKEVEAKPKLKCDICGYVAKTSHGLTIHGHKHKKEDK